MKVIINADDLGYNEEVNSAIEKAIQYHRISSTSIMANSPFFNDAIRIAKEYQYISYGVHLNLIEFKPLSDAKIFKKYNLVDSNGEFRMGKVFTLKEFPEELKDAIKEEWKTQIRKVANSGIHISHLDSHQHTHAIYELEDLVIELLEEYNIHRIRRQFYVPVSRMLRERKYEQPIYGVEQKRKASTISFFSKLWRHFITLPYYHQKWVRKMKRHARMADDFFVYQIFVQEIKNHAFFFRNKVIEVECHPGLLTNKNETSWLMQDKLREYSNEYQLICYQEI